LRIVKLLNSIHLYSNYPLIIVTMKIIFTVLSLLLIHFSAYTQVSEKELKKSFAPKGNHRSPFKGATEACLVSVNLQFKLASKEQLEKRNTGKVISWAFLEGIDDRLMQEIADEYYVRLEKKFNQQNIILSQKFRDNDSYQKLVDKNKDRERETYKKNWGISKIFTSNKEPYVEYPVMAMGNHASMGNQLKMPVGSIFLTIDFAEFILNISKSTTIQGLIETKSKSTLVPHVRIEAVTQSGPQMRGDGSYSLFTGTNWGFTNAILTQDALIQSDLSYATATEAAKGIPESMKRFKSNVTGDLVGIFSGGLVGNGRRTGEFTYTVYADPVKYKAAVLDALDKYNDYLIAYINSNR
jgi:hypothetical protein